MQVKIIKWFLMIYALKKRRIMTNILKLSTCAYRINYCAQLDKEDKKSEL